MDRLEIARTNYARIFPGRYQLDEQKSEELEAWLQDDVVPIVADLQRLPAFRQNVRFGLSRLVSQADTPERVKVVAVSNALVDAAREILKYRHLDGEAIQDENKKKQQQQHKPQDIAESWDITAKIAECPWFDFAVDLDFPCYQHHLYLTASDSALEEAFDRFRADIPILGDGVTRLMFARIEFWVHHLQQAWNRVLVRLSTASNTHADFEQFFATKIQLDQCLEDLRSVCLSGNDARMRDACCTLIQVYIAYHPRPQLPWLALTEDRYQAVAGMLRLEFRRMGEVIECERVDSKTIREKNRRSAKLVVIEALQKVASALEDVATLYRSSLSPEELVEEARFQHRLVVVTKPRMAFFEGDKINVDWNKKSKPWEMLRYLAAKGEQLKCVDQYDLSGSPSPSALSTTKGRLCQYLMDSDPSPNSAASQLACCIETTREGEYYLDLAPHQIKLLDLESLGANEWTIDPAEFEVSQQEKLTFSG